MKRTYLPADEAMVDKKRQEFLQAHCYRGQPTGNNSSSGDHQWAENFSPRSSVEPVKNCTRIMKNVQQEIIQILTSVLLQTQNIVQTESGAPWNAGGNNSIL